MLMYNWLSIHGHIPSGADLACYDKRHLLMRTTALHTLRGVAWVPVPEKLHTLLPNEISTNLC